MRPLSRRKQMKRTGFQVSAGSHAGFASSWGLILRVDSEETEEEPGYKNLVVVFFLITPVFIGKYSKANTLGKNPYRYKNRNHEKPLARTGTMKNLHCIPMNVLGLFIQH